MTCFASYFRTCYLNEAIQTGWISRMQFKNHDPMLLHVVTDNPIINCYSTLAEKSSTDQSLVPEDKKP